MEERNTSIVEYQARDGSRIKLTPAIIKKYLVSGRAEFVTDQELYIYMGLCKSRGLNPFIKDCHLVKYTPNENAAIITSIDYYRKRARAQADCRGWKTGIIVMANGKLTYREGCIVLDGENLVGGWCEGQPEGWAFPMRKEVNLKRYIKKTKDGNVTRFWSEENQPEMIAKVAESQLLRALWPDEFQGLYVDSEMQSHDAQATLNQAVATVSDPEPGPTFKEAFAAEITDPLFVTFISEYAQHYGESVEKTKAAAIAQIQVVKDTFLTWKTKRQEAAKIQPAETQPQQPPVTFETKPAEPERTFRDEWINLTQKGFSTYVFKNLDRFRAADAVIRADAIAKWKKFYPQNQPPISVAENTPPETQGEAAGSTISPQPIAGATASDENRAKLIRECQSYGPEVFTEAKKAMGVSEREADWPPSVSGMGRLLDECIRIEDAMKGR